ncbi:MAG: hypothetical protein ABW189_07885 [Rickettsiales bacterium]
MSLTEMLLQSVNKKNAERQLELGESQEADVAKSAQLHDATSKAATKSIKVAEARSGQEISEEESFNFDIEEESDSDSGDDVEIDEEIDEEGESDGLQKYKKMERPAPAAGATLRKRKIVATVKSPLIDASLHGRFRFKTRDEAVERIKDVADRFVKSSLTPEDRDDALILWVKGYDLTPDEEEKGCVGNYAFLYCEELTDGRFTLRAQKLEADPQSHPQRRRRKGKHPDWGYYVLRRIKKDWRYHSVEEAYADLLKLAEDFPQVSIPARNKLYTIIYQKPEDNNGIPLYRAVLEIEPNGDKGGFCITCKENEFRRNTGAPSVNARPVVVAAPEVDGKPAAGYFTSMLEMKRAKRKPALERRKPVTGAAEQNDVVEEETSSAEE